MKLLVFAHTPPPHHGQSYMVQLMLEGFGGDHRQLGRSAGAASGYGVECYHVNARLSKGIHQIGRFQPQKIFLLIGYCLQAIWCRFRYGVANFYYVPAPGQRGALYRDWVVMLLCRPFFKRVIFHWHAAGLTEWLKESGSPMIRGITRRLLGRADLSIVLSRYNIQDAESLGSRRFKIVHNGTPDPCPHFEQEVLPRRKARFAARQTLIAARTLKEDDIAHAGSDSHIIKLLYLAHCSREKGLFDAVEAVALANQELFGSNSPLRFELTVAGEFVESKQRQAFEERIARTDLQIRFAKEVGVPELPRGSGDRGSQPAIRYVGFLSSSAKHQALAESDCLCFPTYFHAESFGLAIIEAMAFGLPILATRWRSIPELFPADYKGLVEIRSPVAIVQGLRALISDEPGKELRNLFLRHFSLPLHLADLAEALKLVPGRNDVEGLEPKVR